MSVISKHIIRNIRDNRISGLLIVISLAISTAVVYLNLNINTDMLAISRKLFEGVYAGYDICVIADEDEDISLQDVAFEGAELLPIRLEGGSYSSEYKDAQATVILESAPWQVTVEKGMTVLKEGTLPSKENQVGISEKKSLYYNIGVGDTVTVTRDEQTTRYTVSCIFSSLGIFQDERREMLELLNYWDPTLPVKMLYADVDAIGDAQTVADRWQAEHTGWNISLTNQSGDTGEQLAAIRKILYMMFALTVVMGYYVISSVSTMMLDARLPVIGTFRSVGASRRRMNGLLLLENTLYGLMGGGLGIAVGALLRYLLAAIYYGAADARHAVNPVYIGYSVGFAVLLQVMIVLLTLIRSKKRSIKESIFRTTAVATELPLWVTELGAAATVVAGVLHLINRTYQFWYNVVALVLAVIGGICLLPHIQKQLSTRLSRLTQKKGWGPLYLAFKNMAVSRIDISSAILTAAVTALGMVIFLSTTAVSNFYAGYADNYPYDIFIKGLGQPDDAYSFLKYIPGVESFEIEHWDYCDAQLNGKMVRVCFVQRNGYPNGITIPNRADNNLENGHVLVDETFAARNGLKVGDTAHFVRGDGTAFDEQIDGFCDSGIFNAKRTSVLMTEEDFASYIELSPATIGINLWPGTDIDETMSLLSAQFYLQTGETASVRSKEAYMIQEISGTQNAIKVFSVVPIFTVLLAVLGLVNNQIIAYNRKRREYAVLYSVAMSRSQLGQMVFAELVMTFSLGCIYGILLSIWLVRITRDVIFGLVAYLDIEYDVGRIALLFVGALALLSLTALLPQSLARKTNVIEEIKYE